MKTKITLLTIALALFGITSNAQGNFLWAKRMGGASSDAGQSIAVDATGNVYTTGYFSSTADFDPGAGVFNLTTAGAQDIFVSKLDASGAFVWAKRIGGPGTDYGSSIAVDAAGNVYTTGYFIGTVDFDPGAGVYNLTAGFRDIFVSKLDASGAFIWAKSMGGATADDIGYSIAVDGSGNVYTTGYFQGTADFDPGVAVYTVTTTGGNDIFVSKLDASGAFVWAKGMGGATNDYGYSIAVDAAGNVHTTGYFNSTADFDPGASVYNLTSAGSFDIFVSKLDVSGAFVWAKSMGGAGSEIGQSITVDGVGNVYTTGAFNDTTDFDPGVAIYKLIPVGAGFNDIFVSKLNASGAFVWAKSMGGASGDYGYSIAVNAIGNVYTTGFFTDTADFDPGVSVYNLTAAAGAQDIFVSKLDASGAFVWAKGMGGTPNDYGYSIAVDGAGNVYTAGYFASTADFDPGVGVYNLTSAGLTDIFVSKLGGGGVGIAEASNSFNTLTIYPNPAGEILNVELKMLNEKETTIQISNTLGQVVLQETATTQHSIFNIQHLPTGMYYLTIKGKDIIETKKIVLQR